MSKNPFSILADVSFAPKDVQTLLDEMVADYERAYLEGTGKRITLPAVSETRIQLYTQALRFYQVYQLIDYGFRMNLPKYSSGAFLDNLASIMLGPNPRQPAKPSYCSVEFTLSALRPQAVTIPAGTRVSTSDNLFFATQEALTIPPGKLTVQGSVVSLATGAATAGILPGQLNALVDPVPYVASAINVTTSQGGSDVENDNSLKLRMTEFQNSRSTAGSEVAYRYFVRSFSQAVEGISVVRSAPGEVNIYLTLTGGQLPDQPFLDALEEYLADKRPLTDHLTISAPQVQEYQINATYYIAGSDKDQAEEIQRAVSGAVKVYEQWQSSQIGRDLLPDKLVSLMVAAGAKRVPITSPVYTQTSADSICQCTETTLTFGGVESD